MQSLINILHSQDCALEVPPSVRIVNGGTFQGQGKEPSITQVQFTGQPVVTSSWWLPTGGSRGSVKGDAFEVWLWKYSWKDMLTYRKRKTHQEIHLEFWLDNSSEAGRMDHLLGEWRGWQRAWDVSVEEWLCVGARPEPLHFRFCQCEQVGVFPNAVFLTQPTKLSHHCREKERGNPPNPK